MKSMNNSTKHTVRNYPTVGVCGLDCGLCPRYHTEGASRCPGCFGPEFYTKHPSCGFITCCVKKRYLEICSQCAEFPCPKFDCMGKRDSFITYRNVMKTHTYIKEHGIESYFEKQEERIALLEEMLSLFNDGRSKSLYCTGASLIPLESLKTALASASNEAECRGIEDSKSRAKVLRQLLQEAAATEGVSLVLRNKGCYKDRR